MGKKKILWINTLKAIGIILVVIGHNDTIFTKYIYSFHMALFFFLSGITFRGDNFTEDKTYVKRKVKSLLKPYFIYSIFLYIIWIPLEIFQGKEITLKILLNNLIGILYSQGGHKFMDWGIPMWFLPCMFVVSVGYYYLKKIGKNDEVITLVILAFLGYLTRFLPFRLPWSLDTALTGIVFYSVGNILREKIIMYKPSKKDFKLSIAIIIITFVVANLNGRIDFYSNQFSGYIIFYLVAFSMIYVLINLAKIIKPNKISNLIGINTLIILAFHIRVLEIIKFGFIKVLKIDLNFNSLIMGGIILPIVQIGILLIAIKMFNYFKERLIGKYKFEKHR